MIYRIHNGLVDIPANIFLHPNALSTRGHSLKFMLPYCWTDVYRFSFFPSGIRLWNQCRKPSSQPHRWRPSRRDWRPTTKRNHVFYRFLSCTSPHPHLTTLYIHQVRRNSRVGPAL